MCTGPGNVNLSGGTSQTAEPKILLPFFLLLLFSMRACKEKNQKRHSISVSNCKCVNVYCDGVVGFFVVASCVRVACVQCTLCSSSWSCVHWVVCNMYRVLCLVCIDYCAEVWYCSAVCGVVWFSVVYCGLVWCSVWSSVWCIVV